MMQFRDALKRQGALACDEIEGTIQAEKCLERAADYEQVAAWLTELKRYKTCKQSMQSGKIGCKYCKYNLFDHIYMGTNICDKYRTHIDPYSEGYCDGFESREIHIPDKSSEDTSKTMEEDLWDFLKS